MLATHARLAERFVQENETLRRRPSYAPAEVSVVGESPWIVTFTCSQVGSVHAAPKRVRPRSCASAEFCGQLEDRRVGRLRTSFSRRAATSSRMSDGLPPPRGRGCTPPVSRSRRSTRLTVARPTPRSSAISSYESAFFRARTIASRTRCPSDGQSSRCSDHISQSLSSDFCFCQLARRAHSSRPTVPRDRPRADTVRQHVVTRNRRVSVRLASMLKN